MTVTVHCPHRDCGQSYKVAASHLGHPTICNRCGREFTLEVSPVRPPPLAGQGAHPPLPPEAAGEMPAALGRFQVGSRLGVGAFGAVYRALDPLLEREVALKVPRAAALERPDARARFFREAKAAAQLRHPHIVPVYETGSDGDRFYLVSAFIEGRTLEAVIDQQRPDFRRAATIVRDLSAALQYAHSKGVVHRDVKPGNIMIDIHGDALLMDFGLALVESSQEKLTQEGSVMGTPAYMAPEQADGSMGEVGPASDQYSLGVVLYELLCGEPPFDGPLVAVLVNVVHQAPESPRAKNPAVPQDLETICLRAMAKRAADRYPNCGELAEDLRRWLDAEPIRARRMGLVERVGRWARRNPAVAALSVAAAILLVTVAAVANVAYVRTSQALSVASVERQRAEDQRRSAEWERQRAEEQTQIAQENARRAQEHERLAKQALSNLQAETAARAKVESEKTAEMRKRLKLAEEVKQKEAQIAAGTAALDAAKQAAETAAEEHKAALEANSWLKYMESLEGADEAFEKRDLSRARELLDACPEEHRAWEWYFLRSACNGLQPTGGIQRDLAVERGARYLAVSSNVRWICRTFVRNGSPGEIYAFLTTQPRRVLASIPARDLMLLSPDGDTLLVRESRSKWTVFGSRGGRETAPPIRSVPAILPFSKDGKLVLVSLLRDAPGETSILSLETLRAVRAVLQPSPFEYTTFTAQGELAGVQIAGDTAEVRIAEIASRAGPIASSLPIRVQLRPLAGDRITYRGDVLFSHDQRVFALFVQQEGEARWASRHWDARRVFVCTARPPRLLCELSGGQLISISPDDKRLALRATGGVELWDVAKRRKLPALKAISWMNLQVTGPLEISSDWTRVAGVVGVPGSTGGQCALFQWGIDKPLDTAPAE